MHSLSQKVKIIVLNYNGQDCLPDCLRALEKLDCNNFSVIVVDNNSKDGSYEQSQRIFPQFSYLRIEKNVGFAGGMNRGIEKAMEDGAEWIWLLNNDAEVETDSLGRLLEVVGKEEYGKPVGALSPVIRERQTKKIWFAKGKIDFFRMRVRHEKPEENELKKECFESEFLTGCALLVSRKAFESIGMLDESFFLYYEDADFCLRLKKTGFRRLVVPRASVLHSERSNNNPTKVYHLVYSGLLFFKKHASFPFQIYFSMYVTIREIKNRVDIWRGRDEAQSVRRAYEDFYHGTRP